MKHEEEMRSLKNLALFLLGFFIVTMFVTNVDASPTKDTGPEKRVKVAVIDTGYSEINHFPVEVPLCKGDHYDFNTRKKQIAPDLHGHGTAMASIVAYSVGNNTSGYCVVVYNVTVRGQILAKAIAMAIYKATLSGVKVINISMEGRKHNIHEENALRYAASKGVRIFVAAGNSKINLNELCAAYPACYKSIRNLTVVGAYDEYANRASYSNYGRNVTWMPGKVLGVSGTSAASAYAAGQYIKYLVNPTDAN